MNLAELNNLLNSELTSKIKESKEENGELLINVELANIYSTILFLKIKIREEKISALNRLILKLVPIILLSFSLSFSYSETYFTIPFSIPNEPIVFPSLKKSFSWPIKNIPFVPRYTATIFVEINLANKLIAVLIPDKNEVLIKFIDYNLKSSHSEKSYLNVSLNNFTSSW